MDNYSKIVACSNFLSITFSNSLYECLLFHILVASLGKQYDIIVTEAVEENGMMCQRLLHDVVLIRYVS